MTLTKNSEIELYIESFTSEGSGVGHFGGMAVFVYGAAAGDTVKAHIIKVKKTYAVGKAIEILKKSDSRISSDCRAFPSCGGCAFRHVTYEAELEYKRQRIEDAFSRLAGIDAKIERFIGADSLNGYRNKAEYPVAYENSEVKIGFYAARSHRIVNCGNCLLQPPVFSEIVKEIGGWIEKNGVSVCDARTGKGLVRHIYLRQASVTGQIMACIVINGDDIPEKNDLFARLSEFPEIKSVVLNINKSETNVILGERNKTLRGEDYIFDELCGVKIRLSPNSFYQVNHAQAQRLYEIAAEFVEPKANEVLLDMYCGAGTIGLSMADRVKKVIGAEIVPEAVRDAKFNARLNGIKNAEYYCMDAGEASEMLKKSGVFADIVVLDPPRKGCSAQLIETVCEIQPDRIVYVSCEPSTLARDCKMLRERGYEVKRLAAVDLFPRTVHVESVCLLKKAN